MVDLHRVRQIHLDFHTPGFVKVGDKFNAQELFDILEDSRVNSLTFFAKCHHGYSYFDTKIGTRHPGLSIDLFGEAASEARKRKIGFLAYFSQNVDEVIAQKHPEWVALRRDGRLVDSQILQDGAELYWRWICPNRGGYMEEFFFPHIEECLSKYRVDGVYVDMAGYLPGSCFCDKCLELMGKQGLDPDNELEHTQFNLHTMQRLTVSLRELMDKYHEGMRLEIGCFNGFGEARKAGGVISEFYVESLSYQTGWFLFPIVGRYLMNAGLPVVGVTGRFLKNWGDFGTVLSPHQLKAQLAEHLSIGATSCIGDHMHCNGSLEKGVYSVIKDAFSFIETRQPYCCGMERAREIAVVVPQGIDTSAACSDRRESKIDIWDTLYGASKLLLETHCQWDIISPDMPLDGLNALILIHPYLSEHFIEKLEEFVHAGGNLIVDAAGILVEENINSRWHRFIGIESAEMSPHPGSYYRVIDRRLSNGLPEMSHYVHAPSVEVTTADHAEVLASTIYPPCVRSRERFYGHFHGPDIEEGGPAITSVKRGKGRVIVLSQSVISAYLNTGYHAHRTMLNNLLEIALPERIVRTNAPSILEITAGFKDGRTVLQFIPFIADRRHRYSFESLNESVAIRDVEVTISGLSNVQRIFDPVSSQEITFNSSGEVVSFKPPGINEHTLLLAETCQ